jgi:Tfp pilus assembly protein PilF
MLHNKRTEKILDFAIMGFRPYIWLSVIIAALYLSSLFYQYTFFDDQVLILNRLDFFKHLSNFPKIFNEDVFNNYTNKFYYRPVLTATFFIDGWISGGKLWMFHLSNIIYHIFACWLVFLFLKRLLKDQLNSFLLTLIFAVHPIITQVIVWIPGRNDSLITIFSLLVFLGFLKYLHSRNVIYAFISLVFFCLALLIKELAVFLPLLIFGFVLLFDKEQKKRIIIPAVVWIIILFIYAVIRKNVLGNTLGQTNYSEILKSVLSNLTAIPGYLGKIFIPVHLSVYPNLNDMFVPVVIGSVFILLIIGSFFYKPAGKKIMLFGIIWFLIFLIPGFIKAANMSEHRVYLPLVGILLFSGGLISNLKVKYITVFIPLLMILISLNILHSKNFKDRLTLWQQAVESSPSSAFNANNLGAMYTLRGDYQMAEKYFRKALQLNPAQPLVNGNLGMILMNTNRLNEAELYLLRENQINPNYDNAYFNLGNLYFRKGIISLGVDYYIKTISVNPGYTDAYKALYIFYQNNNQPDFARRIYEVAMQNGIKLF